MPHTQVYILSDRQTDREKDKHMERQTNTHTDRQIRMFCY